MKNTLLLVSLLVFTAFSITCQQGFVANPLNICIQPRYIEGCSQYLLENSCKTCGFRYTLQPNGLCELDPESTEDCCASRAGDGSCTKCQDGIYFIDGKCQQSNIIGCLEKDNQGVCLNCASDYFLNNGVCSKTIKDCAAFTDETRSVCVGCSSGFSLFNNYCVENSVIGCKNEVDHSCQECYPPFTLTGGHCTIKDCKAYNDYGCVGCECGNYLTDDLTCKKMELGCVRYQRGVCTDCLINFTLKGSQCSIQGCLSMSGITCSSCDATKYDNIDGGCVLKNCLVWKDGDCKICQQGYSKSADGCIPSPTSLTTE